MAIAGFVHLTLPLQFLSSAMHEGLNSMPDSSKILLESNGIDVFSLNDVAELDFYIDGADEVSPDNILIKGGGGALTREKIVASASREFICIVDKSKMVDKLGAFPLPIEVIPESRSLVARKIISLGGIIGGLNSSVSKETENVLLEAAYFVRISIASTGR